MFKRLVKRTKCLSLTIMPIHLLTVSSMRSILCGTTTRDYCKTKFQGILHIFNVQELASAIKDLLSNIFILASSNLY